MHKYYLFFSMLFLLINFGYAFKRLGQERTDVVSIPLLLLSIAICVSGLVWTHKRYKKRRQDQPNASNARPESK